jgi:hypothetical protein
MQSQQAVCQQAAVCSARPLHALPVGKQSAFGKPLREASRQLQAAPRCRKAASKRVQAIVAEPAPVEAASAFPRGAHWQVGACRRRRWRQLALLLSLG